MSNSGESFHSVLAFVRESSKTSTHTCVYQYMSLVQEVSLGRGPRTGLARAFYVGQRVLFCCVVLSCLVLSSIMRYGVLCCDVLCCSCVDIVWYFLVLFYLLCLH